MNKFKDDSVIPYMQEIEKQMESILRARAMVILSEIVMPNGMPLCQCTDSDLEGLDALAVLKLLRNQSIAKVLC